MYRLSLCFHDGCKESNHFGTLEEVFKMAERAVGYFILVIYGTNDEILMYEEVE